VGGGEKENRLGRGAMKHTRIMDLGAHDAGVGVLGLGWGGLWFWLGVVLMNSL